MRKLVIANWKLHPRKLAAAARLLKALGPAVRRSRASAVFCPPVPYLGSLKAKFPKLVFGAQDAFYADEGPYTGAVGPEELKELGARYVIIGHSERRATFGETDALVAKKLKAVIAEGLTAVLCVGEPLAVRRKGIAASRRFVAGQLGRCTKDLQRTSQLIIAYEPVWAISTSGSGKAETPKDAVAMIEFIKAKRKAKVLYGGSVSARNAMDFLACRGIDGLLVGRASLSSKEFGTILRDA